MDKRFKEWLLKERGLKSSTAASRVANITRIEKIYGDVDKILLDGSIEELLNNLSYSSEDERRKEPPKHRVPIIGNLRTGSATLKNALTLYQNFFYLIKLKKIREAIQSELHQFNLPWNYRSFSREEVKRLIQEPIAQRLSSRLTYIKWSIEHQLDSEVKDSIDIFGEIDETTCVVIEIDTVRTDQICKKFVSRQALTANMNCIYVIITYPNANSNYNADNAAIPKFEKYMKTLTELISKGSKREKHILIHNLYG